MSFWAKTYFLHECSFYPCSQSRQFSWRIIVYPSPEGKKLTQMKESLVTPSSKKDEKEAGRRYLHTPLPHPLQRPPKAQRIQEGTAPRWCRPVRCLKVSGHFLLGIKTKLYWGRGNKPGTHNGSDLPAFPQLLHGEWVEHPLHGGAVDHDHTVIFSANKK